MVGRFLAVTLSISVSLAAFGFNDNFRSIDASDNTPGGQVGDPLIRSTFPGYPDFGLDGIADELDESGPSARAALTHLAPSQLSRQYQCW